MWEEPKNRQRNDNGGNRAPSSSTALENSPDVITGMIKIFTFDVVSTPVGDSILAKKVYRDCTISVNYKGTMADLIELDIVDFGAILGMGWLHGSYALVDCRTQNWPRPTSPTDIRNFVELAGYYRRCVHQSQESPICFQSERAYSHKVSPMKDVMRFRKKGKLSPRYIGPYRISKRVGNLAYELELPSQLATVHLVFHISMLKKYMGDPSIIVPTKNIGIKDDLSYEEMPVQILNYQVRKLRTKEVASVKVL
ncbi:hypothetical protein MTR67_039092 [Solanum verrucosum]|uniref:Tf2-1-like SH3-like domain-containing protein n=1 Tax=Solanum verrucosum TaxID=315347 RepID=A0AAF0ZNB5_SOLVR|nr:hypothetical protein MTR67_039092 [Solanum verrucosum]